jgi:signal transduction histidine kinase
VLKNELSKSAEFSKMQKSLEAFSKISTMVDNTLKTTRGIISGLRPDVIEILGFVDTVKAYVKEFGIRNTIISNFTTNFEKLKLNQTVELSLFRIIQEALTNISKHAMATKVFVDLNTSENTITLSISDNGVGFELDKSQKVNHYGVLGMKERVYLIEGELKIETGPGKGTKINITLPKSKSIVDE